MSAFGGKADISSRLSDVCFLPIADTGALRIALPLAGTRNAVAILTRPLTWSTQIGPEELLRQPAAFLGTAFVIVRSAKKPQHKSLGPSTHTWSSQVMPPYPGGRHQTKLNVVRCTLVDLGFYDSLVL
jgi:hypothetical protein